MIYNPKPCIYSSIGVLISLKLVSSSVQLVGFLLCIKFRFFTDLGTSLSMVLSFELISLS